MKADKTSWFGLVGLAVIISAALVLGGCGNTIQGIGTDITDAGKKVTVWQNEPSKEKPKKAK